MSEAKFDAGLHAAQRLRALRRWALLLIALAVFLETQGEPALRTSYVEQGGRVRSARYWCVTGERNWSGGEVAPLIVLVPLERPLLSYAGSALQNLVSPTEN